MTKVVKVYLLCNVTDRDDKKVDYKAVNRILWDLQKETRAVKNKAVQLCWEWFNFQSEYKNKHGEYPKPENILHYKTLDGYVNNKLKIGNSLHSGNLSISIRDVCKHFRKDTKEYIKGTKTLVNYKQNQPLDLHNKRITLKCTDDDFVITLALLNKAGNDKYNIQRFDFTPLVKDKAVRCILERCIDGIYKISASKLMYDDKKKMWKLNLNYTFTSESATELDKDTILGVDLGISFDDAFLKQWSYYDLQQKITNKAAEYGIEVIKINPEYTSQRCSKCGFIHKDNRSTQSKFECLQCGFKENADYNASQNIAIRDIDKIIEGANIK